MSPSRAIVFGVAGLLAAGAVAMAATPPAGIDSLDSPPNVGSIDWAAPAERAAVPTATERRPIAGERVPTGNPLWAVPLRTLSATLERPLFSPSRRPPAPPMVAAPAAPPPPPRAAAKPAEPDHPLLSLLGTVVGEKEAIGVFMEEANRNVVRLRTGDDYAGWVLKAVEGRDARFEKNERNATLSLPPNDGSQPAAAMLAGASVPAGMPPTPLTPPAPPAALAQSPAAAAPGTTWMDGDGQMIAPPPRRFSQQPPAPIPAAAPAPAVARPVRREN